MEYEIIVVGGGHAGCEAALVSARKGFKTLLITSNLKNVADMPCNPSMGGSAKGTVIREIDALGGEMAKNIDKALLQIKMLNISKGPAVRSLRAQVDKHNYPKEMLKTLQKTKNLTLKEDLVEDLIIKNNIVQGVITKKKELIKSKITILTTGTYLKSNVLVGHTSKASGPDNEQRSNFLSDNLKKYGFKIVRLKTGTPARIAKESVDYKGLREEKGNNLKRSFSYNGKANYKIKEQLSCYLTYTNEKTHQIIKDNLKESSMFSGLITGKGPRYCPSVEDKIVRFADKNSHQVFLEPESKNSNSIYLQGMSSSMPENIQLKMIKSLKGLEKAKILKYGYAIEYDAIYPTQLKLSLETKLIKNLYTAGQINGTSGYEEAAAQGLIAGINATLNLIGKQPLILKRYEAYIGVLIDDLVTKGTYEPYRLLTSRAEYRLLLRQDNADLRLRKIGYKVGLVNQKDYDKHKNKEEKIKTLMSFLEKEYLYPTKTTNNFLKKHNSTQLKDKISFKELLKRPEITLKKLSKLINLDYDKEIFNEVEITIKYEGYIKKMLKEVSKQKKYETKKIPLNLDYNKIPNLASEAKEKLKEVRPTSIGQAMRIIGVNPSDISILLVILKGNKYERI